MNKKISLILLLIVVVLLIVGYTQIVKQTSQQDTPDDSQVPQNSETLFISLGQEFTLHENQLAVFNDIYKIKITGFFNSPCPEDVQCIWSGVGIAFRHNYRGEVKEGTNLVQAFGYQTIIIDTDYETFAKLKIIKME